MASFQLATRRRGRNRCLRFLPVLFLLVSLHSEAASSASLSVKIRQLNPASEVQQVTCNEHKKCVLPIGIQTGATKQTLTVHVLFAPGNVLFEFETAKGFLYAGDKSPSDKQHAKYRAMWQPAQAQNTPASSNITLFLPSVSLAATARILTVPQQPVADLEITTEETP
jgi:hypothetical protein